MNYIFYTDEGYCESPTGNQIENLQVLGFSDGEGTERAYESLLSENQWIKDEQYNEYAVTGRAIISDDIFKDVSDVVKFMWNSVKKIYDESDNDDIGECIYHSLERLKEYFGVKV